MAKKKILTPYWESTIPESQTPAIPFKIFDKDGNVSIVHVSYEPGARPVVYYTRKDNYPIFYGTFTQVSRLVSGLIGKKVKVISWISGTGMTESYGKVVFDNESH